MATDPQTILNQSVPVASQPTATQAPISQINQTVPIAQLPGVAGQGNAFQQPAQLLSTASPGQPTQPGLLSFANSPTAQPYYSMVPFLAALEQQPQITLPNYGDPALQGIQQRLIAQQQSSPLLSGKQPISPVSVMAKTQAPMSVGELLTSAGQQLWQQEIVNPVQDYINTWKRDPTQGLLETLGGVAVIGGLVGLEAITAGAATPFIFGAMAALQAPNLIGSWAQEITHPSDQHLVQALVSSGSAAIAVGSPVKAFKGIKVARTLLEAQVALRKSVTSADRVAELLTGFREAGGGIPFIKTGAALTRQFETLNINDVEALTKQLEARGIDYSDEKEPAAQLVMHAQTLSKLRDDIEAATSAGDHEAVADAMGEIKKLGPELRSAMLSTAYHHIFLPSTPYAHVPVGAIKGIGAETYDAVNKSYNSIYGMLRQMHAGIGLSGPSDMATANIASIKEAEGLDRAAGTPYDTANRIELKWREIQDALGVSSEPFTASTPSEFLSGKPGIIYGYRGAEEGHPGEHITHFTSDPDYAGLFAKFRGRLHRVAVKTEKPFVMGGENTRRLIEKAAELGIIDAADVEKTIADLGSGAPSGLGSPELHKWLTDEGYDAIVGHGAPGEEDSLLGIGLHPSKVNMYAGEMADDPHEFILQALESPAKWKVLTVHNPEWALYGQKLRDFFDAMTAGELKRGYIPHALQGRVPYSFTGPALLEDEKAQALLETQAELPYKREPKPYGSKSRQWKMAVDELGNVSFQTKTRAQIIKDAAEDKDRYEKTHEHRQIMGDHEKDIRRWRKSYGHHKPGAKKTDPIKADAIVEGARKRLGDVGAELITMKNDDIKKIMKAAPPGDELVTGAEAVRRAFRSHTNRMQQAVFREAAQAHSNLATKKLGDIFKKMPMANWGSAMITHPEFADRHELPDVLPETVWRSAGSIEDAAQKMGYFPIFPAVGKKGDLNFQPALFGRGELANKITKAIDNSTSAQAQTDFLSSIYKVSGVSKRFIMYNPVYHALNVAGRAIAFVLSDPAVAGSAFKAINQLRKDPAAYASLMEESAMAGMVHATQWNVGEQLRHLLREEDGHSGFLGAIRSGVGALNNIHRDTMERGLWETVDQLQLAGYLYSKQRFLSRGIGEFEARRLAGQYANNLGGMVNPLYMGRLWRQMKGMIFFAPSYWSTFLHSLQSVMPGSARLSGVVNKVAGGRFAGLSAVPLRAIDQRSRIELVRAQRDWMITYLASTAVAMDMMNVMFSGHHLWDNEPGHEWDVDVTNMPGFGGTQTSPSGEVRRAYITSMPFFRQGVDIGNAIGLGHDWGFGHVFGDATWQQQDALHKASMATGALLDGMRRTASTKIGQIPATAYGLAAGEDLTARLGQGTQVKVDRPLALASLAPMGYQLQRLWKTYQQDTLQYAPGSPQYQQAQQQFEQNVLNFVPAALLNQTGVPSVYHMGVERTGIDDSKYENWVTQRTASQSRMTQYSTSVFAGQMSPLEYARHKHEEQIRLNQLNADTWGQNSPGATLNSAYTSLAQQFGLDNTALSDQDWFERYDLFLPAWEQLLQSAQPATRAAWWEHSTSTWTDADYLEWEARQLRDSLAASIDGQGGNYIRSFQNQLFRLKPSLTVAEYTQMEQDDPYYSAYKTLLTSMGSTSALGAFVSAFSSPYTKTYIPPAGTTEDEAQALAAHTGQVVVRPETAQAQAQRAKAVAQDPNVAQAGGIAAASPEFQQEEQAALQAAQTGTPESQ